MSSILRSLIVRVGADTTKAQSEFKKLANQMKKQGKEIANAGKTLTMGLTLPIVGAAAAAVKFASDMEESTNKVNVAFKDNAKQVDKWSDTTLTAFGIAKGSALDMAATYGDMGTAMGQTTQEAANMSMSLVGLAGDLASFKNISLEQASDALRGIYTGEGEALKTLGIIMQDNTLIAYAQAEGYKKSYKEMTQAEKVALRYKYVMSVTKNAQGDFARTSDGVANQMRMVKESLKQAAASMGTVLLPMVAKVLKKINEWLKVFQGLTDSQKKTIVTIGLLVAAIGPVVTLIGKLYTGLSKAFTMINAFSMAIKGGQGLIAALGGLLGPAGVVMLAVAAIAILAGIFITASENAKEAAREANQFADTLKESSETFKANTKEIQDNANVAGQLVNELFDLRNKENKSNEEKKRMVTLVSQINELMPDMNLMIDEQTGLLNMNKEAVMDYIDAKERELLLRAEEEREVELLKERLEIQQKLAQAKIEEADAMAALEEYSSKWHSNMLGGTSYRARVKAATDAVKTYTKALDTNTKELESNGDESAKAAQAVDKLDYYYEESADSALMAASSIAEQTAAAVEMAAKTKERLDSLKSSWFEYSEQVTETTQSYIDAMGDLGDDGIQETELTAAQIKKNLDKQIQMFKDWRENIKKLSSKVPADVMEQLEQLGPEFAPVIEELNQMTQEELDAWIATWREKTGLARDAAIDKMGPLPNKMRQIGRASGQGFIDGLNDKIEELESTATTFGSTVTKRLENVLEVASPSKAMKRIGRFAGQGFVDGILGTVKNVKSAVDKIGNATTSLGTSPFTSSAISGTNGGTVNNTSGMYTLNVNGSTDPNMVAGIVVQKLRMAGAV